MDQTVNIATHLNQNQFQALPLWVESVKKRLTIPKMTSDPNTAEKGSVIHSLGDNFQRKK